MSWFTDLAGKAENLLNTIDNSAANALNVSNEFNYPNYIPKKEPYLEKNFDEPSNFIPPKMNLKNNTKSETELFKFNSNNKTSEISSDANSDKASSGYKTNMDEYDGNQSNPDTDPNNPFQVENKLLRSEISSLNQEISSLLRRSHRTEEECKKLKNQNEKLSNQIRDGDRKHRQLLSEKDDLDETLKTKDSKIEALSSELKKFQEGVLNKTGVIEQSIVDEYRRKISQLEEEVQNRANTLDKVENEKMKLQNLLEDVNMRLAQTINNHTKLQNTDKRKIESLKSQLEAAKNKQEVIQQELKDYKIKATKILQMKEKEIAGLRGIDTDDPVSISNLSCAASEDTQSQLSEALLEIDRLREEVTRCRVEWEHRDFDLQELDQQMHVETEALKKNVDLLEAQLERERQMREDIETDYRQLTRENRQLQERSTREINEIRELLLEKERQITAMNEKQENNDESIGIKDSEYSAAHQIQVLETRIRSLQDTLMQRQAALESARAELHSLTVVRAEQNLRQSNMNTYLEERNNGFRKPQEFVTINLSDPPATKNCKSALNAIDRCGLKLAVLVRNYPPARMFFVGYSILLHIWLLFIFFTYQPEAHSSLNPTPNNGHK